MRINRASCLNESRCSTYDAILSQADKLDEDALVLSQKAKMAFGNIEWDYLFEVLSRMGFGPKYDAWIRLLYSGPLARMRVNDKNSCTFGLHKGT